LSLALVTSEVTLSIPFVTSEVTLSIPFVISEFTLSMALFTSEFTLSLFLFTSEVILVVSRLGASGIVNHPSCSGTIMSYLSSEKGMIISFYLPKASLISGETGGTYEPSHFYNYSIF